MPFRGHGWTASSEAAPAGLRLRRWHPSVASCTGAWLMTEESVWERPERRWSTSNSSTAREGSTNASNSRLFVVLRALDQLGTFQAHCGRVESLGRSSSGDVDCERVVVQKPQMAAKKVDGPPMAARNRFNVCILRVFLPSTLTSASWCTMFLLVSEGRSVDAPANKLLPLLRSAMQAGSYEATRIYCYQSRL